MFYISSEYDTSSERHERSQDYINVLSLLLKKTEWDTKDYKFSNLEKIFWALEEE
jgi:hypothetical protein